MSLFNCKALDGNGKKVSLTKEAGDIRLLTVKLRAEGLFLLKAEHAARLPKKYIALRQKVPQRELLTFYRQLAIMLRAGGKIQEALASLYGRKGFCRPFRKILRDLYIALLSGLSFSQALKRHKKTFPVVFIKMAEVGENSGALGEVMENMADYYEKTGKIRREVSNATAYPKILVVAVFTVIAFILLCILPTLENSVSSFGEMPEITKFLFRCSRFVKENFKEVAMTVGIAVGGIFIFCITPPGKYAKDAVEMYFPGVKNIYRALIASYFCNAFYVLYSSGMTVTDSLDCICGITGNRIFEKKFRRVSSKVKGGRPIYASINSIRVFPAALIELIRIGESCGGLSEALSSAAKAFDDEALTSAKKSTSLLEPILILLIGALALLVAFSMLLPMLSALNALY